LLAAKFIAEAFGQIATDRAVTVVLVSPNHFSAGRGKIITTAASWRTPYGTLDGDCGAVLALQKAGVATIEEGPFEKEHGISGIVPFIKKSLPHARVVPVIVNVNASDADLDRFTQEAKRAFGPDTLFVASFDFSHDLTATAAKFHDRKSLAVVDGFDDQGAQALDIDSMPGLRLAQRLQDQAGAPSFSLLEASNSAELTGRPDQPDVTSYLAGTFRAGAGHSANDDVTLLAFGDLMLARGVAAAIARHGPMYPFEPITRLLIGSDLVTANAEGVFADVPADRKAVKPDDLNFAFGTWLLPTLHRLGFTHLGEANNHALDFGSAALEASRTAMRQSKIGAFGDPENDRDLADMTVVRGRKIAQIGYDQFSGHGPEAVIAAIAEAKKAGAFVVVYPHWGIEYEPKPTQLQISLAHSFIDAGADVVVGSHPHVVQPVEIYNGRAIFYSLGNFIFDQPAGPTSLGLALGIADGSAGTAFYLMPLDIQHDQASLMTYQKRSTLLLQLASASTAYDVKKAMASGIFTLKRP
jgi:poly-gamma-glutamate synthesis protein (capsule biosynthesis protein)